MSYLFISHAHADNDATRKLYADLQAALPTRKFWLDLIDLPNQAVPDYRAKLDSALKASHGVVLVLSRSIKDRANVTAEWNYALEKKLPLYIAKIDDAGLDEIDSRLLLVQWIDMRAAGWDAGMAALAAQIDGRPVEPTAPVIPARVITGKYDSLLRLIPLQGRQTDMQTIRDLLESHITTIIGIGGLGKSRIAFEIAVRGGEPDGAIWHVVNDLPLTGTLGLEEQLRDHYGLDPLTETKHVIAHIDKRGAGKLLVVIDNAESSRDDSDDEKKRRASYVDLIQNLHNAGARVLLTSRLNWNIRGGRTHLLGALDHPTARDLVLAMNKPLDIHYDLTPLADTIAEKARRHARLIEWALVQMRDLPPHNIIADLESLSSENVQDALFEMIHKTVQRMVARDGDITQTALRRLNVTRGGFTYDAAAAITGLDSSALDKTLRSLSAWNFISFNGKRYAFDAFASEVITPDEDARRPHYNFYQALAILHDDQRKYLELDSERENLDAAFAWAIAYHTYAAVWLVDATNFYLANRMRFVQRLTWAEAAAAAIAASDDERTRAAAQVTLGTVYTKHPYGDRRDNLYRAIHAYQTALVYAEQHDAGVAATIHNNLGEAYRVLSEIENPSDNLRAAIREYEQALVYRTPDRAPMEYASTQNNLGLAFAGLANVEKPIDNFHASIRAYEDALVYHTPDRAPTDYAGTQYNLGNTYHALSVLENRDENLHAAMRAYENALIYFTLDPTPMEYAMTQGNLGIVYANLGETAQALACWRATEAVFEGAGLERELAIVRHNIALLMFRGA
jgi:tetratricopeptide (TPR) repeat protein